MATTKLAQNYLASKKAAEEELAEQPSEWKGQQVTLQMTYEDMTLLRKLLEQQAHDVRESVSSTLSIAEKLENLADKLWPCH